MVTGSPAQTGPAEAANKKTRRGEQRREKILMHHALPVYSGPGHRGLDPAYAPFGALPPWAKIRPALEGEQSGFRPMLSIAL